MHPFTPAQIQQYRNEGYTAVPDFFTGAEVTAMQTELQRLKEAGLLRNVAAGSPGQTPGQGKVNLQICPLSPRSPLFRTLPFAAKVRAAVEALLGDDFALRLDQIFLKPGHHGAGTKWHQDNAYFKLADPAQGLGMWTAIHAANAANGTMHIVPRSDRRALAHERDADSDHHIHCAVDETRDPVVPVELPAGGVLFFNYGIAHCTRGNTTDHERAGLALHFLTGRAVEAHPPGAFEPVWLGGTRATGGQAEYGQNFLGQWEAAAGPAR